MASFEDKMKDRVQAMAKGTRIETLSDDEDVREWLVFGRIAMMATIWMAMISAVALVISVRF
ncbi:hypothetical protein A8B78_20380 [Jannaschia sp. EhC01]|uniref:Uncharacterized protein n=1 Tax=Gymnodinialimonas phycosphaerae TaxID=2841589 RepID=A0A975TSS4_9RHOB|nr:hypothetical protein [Gymnodinialimonas phycosphaerae]MBY4893407.1 hypothetical protein [Gymnodinialimonas phycosphaerae]OAN71190.1 hypothetical protein A8B78_20380 [Jannaschia sp. EhC01]